MTALFYYARLLGEQGQYKKASYSFERILRILPQDPGVHFHYGRILGQGGYLFEAHLHLAYAALYSKDEKQIDFHLDQAKRKVSTQGQKDELKRFQDIYDKLEEMW